jgi:hypothetical protein
VAATSGPAWVVGVDAASRPSLKYKLEILGTYGCVEYLDNLAGNLALHVNSPTDGLGRTGNHILVRNCVVTGTSSDTDSSGIVVNGNEDVGGAATQVIIYNNTVSNSGLDTPDGSDPDKVGIFVTTYSNNIWILENTVHDMSGGGIAITANSGNDQTLATYIYTGRNHLFDLWGTGISTKTSNHIVHSENLIHDIEDNGGTSPSKGISGQYGATNLWIINNKIYNAAHGVLRVAGNTLGEVTYVIGNEIRDITVLDGTPTATGYGEAGIAIWGGTHRYVVGNSLYNVPSGIVSPSGQTATILENNIISKLNQAGGDHVYIDLSSTALLANGNLFYDDGGAIKIKMASTTYNETTFNATAYGDGNLAGDPLYTNPASGDLSILTGSPSKDAGIAPSSLVLDVYATYLAEFGVSLEFDRLGASRPFNTTWDIGAYEFGATPPADTTPPALISATVATGGTTLVLTFSEAVGPGAGGSAGWALSLSSGSATATYASGAGTESLTYNLSSTVYSGTTGTVSYTQPGNGLEDGTGNDLVTLSGLNIANSSSQGMPAIPRLRDKPAMKRSILMSR